VSDLLWYRRGGPGGQEENALPGSELAKRLAAEGEWEEIDGAGGDVVYREPEDEETTDDDTTDDTSDSEEVPTDEEPFEGYDEQTIEQLTPYVQDADVEQLDALEAYEIAHANRVGLLELVSKRRDDLAEPDDE